MSISEAFLTICEKAIPAESFFVSLYIQSPYYGGPEEGGWWGSDTSLVAYHEYDTEAGADFAKAQVDALVEDMNKKAKLEFGNHCLKQTEWLEARGRGRVLLRHPRTSPW